MASDGDERKEGIGLTVEAGHRLVVLDDDLVPVEPGSGVIGRLARGGNIPLGYYKDEAKTAATFVIVGRRQALRRSRATSPRSRPTARITLLGRGSVCINTGGEKVYPEEVEAALKSHPDVFDAIVVGVPDERWGRARRRGRRSSREGAEAPDVDDLADHCRTHHRRLQGPAPGWSWSTRSSARPAASPTTPGPRPPPKPADLRRASGPIRALSARMPSPNVGVTRVSGP